MSKRILVATFAREEDLIAAAKTARANDLAIVDAYTPYAVHGLDAAMGLKPSRLGVVCGLLGLSAALFMTWFQHWTSAIDWPINIGGKPWDSLPAFAPIIFESMVLCAGLGTVLVFFLVARLWPGKRPRLIVDGVTNDRFALVVQHDDARYDLDEVHGLFTHCNPTAVEERAEDLVGGRLAQPGKPRDPRYLGWVNMALCAVFVVVVAVNLFAPRNLSRPNWEVFPEMVRSPAYDSLSHNSVLAGGITLQPPVAGAIARGMPPLHFEPATAKEEPAGRVSPENPFPADDPAVLDRGAEVFQAFCACCHGATGGGDGLVTLRSSAAPPPFATGKSREWSDGQLFHLLTYGNTYGNGAMPAAAGQVRRDDRWKVIRYVRHLEAKATKAVEQAAAAASPAGPADGDQETAAAETGESQP